MVFAIPGLVASAVGIAGNVIERITDKYFPDPAKANEFKLEAYKMLQQSDLAQLDVNKEEAKSASTFIAGWRPFIGWVCGAAMVYQFIIIPLGIFTATIINPSFATILLNAPKLDGNLWELLTAMLGMGALRTVEKFKGVA